MFLSDFMVSNQELMFYKDVYESEYIFEGINIVKLMLVSLSGVLGLQLLYYNRHDFYMLSRFERKKIILAKLIVGLFIIVFTGLLFMLIVDVIGLYITDYHNPFLFREYLSIVFFGGYYFLLMSLVLIVFPNLVYFMAVIVLYFVSFLLSDTGILDVDYTVFIAMLHLVFPDVIIGYKNELLLLYGNTFLIIEMFLIINIVIRIYNTQDLTK